MKQTTLYTLMFVACAAVSVAYLHSTGTEIFSGCSTAEVADTQKATTEPSQRTIPATIVVPTVDLVQEALSQNKDMIVVFYVPGCPYCVYIKPHIAKLEKEIPANVTLVTIDVTDHWDYYAHIYGLSTVPTMVYFKSGTEIKRHGSNDKTVTTDDMIKIIAQVYEPGIMTVIQG